MSTLLTQAEMRNKASSHWYFAKDADTEARELFDRHYSRYHYADGRQPKKFIGPGEYILLIDGDGTAIFVWRKFRSMDHQVGVNCAIFRNESNVLSSQLIVEAVIVAQQRWPGERMYTYVNSRKVRSENPGCCFKKAGWQVCGVTKKRGLIIMEKVPE